MKFTDRLKMALTAYKSNGIGLGAIDVTGSADPFAIWADHGKLSARRALDLYIGWAYACIRAISEEIAGLDFELYEIKKDGQHEQIHSHELLDLLDGVNPTQTGYELRYLIASHLEATGNCYIYLEGIREGKTTPTALYPLNPGGVTLEIDKRTFPFAVTGYRYTDNGKIMRFPKEQILHIKYPDPANQFEGVGTIQAINGWIEADNFATEFNRRFFMNGAWTGVMLESDAITPAQIELLRNSFEAAHKGLENAHRAVVLPKGTKASKPNEGMKDMDFPGMQQAMMNKIMAGFRVPRTVLGITDDVNRSNAEATDYVFANRTIKPKMKMICTWLNEFLVPLYGENIYLSFKDPVPENRQLKIEEMKAATGGQAVMSINEAREEYFGLGPVDKGDAVTTDFNKVPLGEPIKSSGAVATKTRSQKRKESVAGKPSAKGARASRARKEISNAITESLAKELEDMNKKAEISTEVARTKGLHTLSDNDFEPIYKMFVSRVDRYEKLMISKIKDYNDTQKEVVLANLEKATKDINEDELFNQEEQVKAFIDLNDPVLKELFKEEATVAGKLIGYDYRLTAEVNKAIEKALALLANSYNDTTRAVLKEKLNAAISSGAGLVELRNMVSDIYDWSNSVRAEMVARTETFRIANDASKSAWQQSGVVKTIKWYTSADEMVCDYCAPQHGQVIGIDEDFYKKGDTVSGNNGASLDLGYSDIGAPPLHVNCRCYIRPEEISVEEN